MAYRNWKDWGNWLNTLWTFSSSRFSLPTLQVKWKAHRRYRRSDIPVWSSLNALKLWNKYERVKAFVLWFHHFRIYNKRSTQLSWIVSGAGGLVIVTSRYFHSLASSIRFFSNFRLLFDFSRGDVQLELWLEKKEKARKWRITIYGAFKKYS